MTMRVGHAHRWRYKSTWHEKKVGHGRWLFVSPQTKYRMGRQMRQYGDTKPGTTFRWRIRGTQFMTKVGRNRYVGRMIGRKRLISRER